MNDQPDQKKPHAHLLDLLKSFDTAMLITRTHEGTMRARPLSLSKEHDQQHLYFATSVDSPKVGEITHDATVLITLQDGKRYISISGTAAVSRERRLIDRLWREPWKVWFPAGKDDPALCLLVVSPTAAEYWDQSGIQGVKHLFDMAKAYATGTTPASGASSDNQKIQFR